MQDLGVGFDHFFVDFWKHLAGCLNTLDLALQGVYFRVLSSNFVRKEIQGRDMIARCIMHAVHDFLDGVPA